MISCNDPLLPHIETRRTHCDSCGERYRRCPITGDVTQELAEVVRNGNHLLIHQSCMKEKEWVALA